MYDSWHKVKQFLWSMGVVLWCAPAVKPVPRWMFSLFKIVSLYLKHIQERLNFDQM